MLEKSRKGFEYQGLISEPQPLGTPTKEPTLSELAGAYFRQENLVGSSISREEGLPDQYRFNPDYDPYDAFTEEEKEDEMFVMGAMYADNESELDAFRKQYARELKDKQIISQGGGKGFLVGLPVMLADPVTFMSVGGLAYKTIKTGKSLLKGGLALGATAGADATLQETVLQQQQVARTYGESALNITGSMLLGGVLGVPLTKMSQKYGVTEDMFKQVDDQFEHNQKIKDGINPTVNEPTPKVGEDSVGAQAVYGDVQISGELAKKIVKVTKFDPLSRLLTSNAPITRQLIVQLAENPIMVDNFTGQAVESLAKTYHGLQAMASKNNAKLYRQYKKGKARKTRLSRTAFKEEVAKALRSGESDIPEVKASADYYQNNLYNPIKEKLIEQRMLTEDVDVTTAVNYVNRVYDTGKIEANFPVFVSKVSKWLQNKDLELFEQAKLAQTKLEKATGEEATKLQELIDKAEFKAGKEFEPQDYDDLASQIGQRITQAPDGRLPYDWQLGQGSKRQSNFKKLNGLRGPLKNRVFTIDDADIEEFLVNDIELLASRYIQQTATDIELKKAFQSVDLEPELKKVDDWYRDQLANPNITEKERIKLGKERKQDNRDLRDVLDRMRGNYGLPSDSIWSRMGRFAKDLNYLRFMGGVTISSLPDMARIIMAEGFLKTMSKGLVPLITNTKAFNIAKEELQGLSIGIDSISGVTGKSEIIADIANYTQGGTFIERLMRAGADGYGKVNALDFFTAGMKQLHAVIMQNRIFSDLEKGIYDKRLGRLGISKENADAMYQQVRKHGRKVNNVWITNAGSWDSPDLTQMYAAAMRKESDRVIVIPGQEKPLFMSSELGSVIGQFRSFTFSSTQRVLIAGLQGQDHNSIGGAFSLISMGMFVYYIKQLERGQPLSDDPKAWVMEGIDRSGAAGILGEANMMIEKVSGNTLGMRPLLDIDAPSSKFVAHSISQSMLGPTFGSLLTDTFKALNSAASEGELSESDIRNIRRMLPYNNLSGFRKAVDALEERLGDL